MLRTAYLLCSAFIWHGGGQKLVKQPDFTLSNSQNCPDISGSVYRQSKVVGSSIKGAVMRKAVTNVTDLSMCVDTCCQVRECNVAMIYNDQCYMVSCTDQSYCLPTSLPSSDQYNSSLVLVRSPSGGSWSTNNNTITTKDVAVTGDKVCEVGVGEECNQDEICRARNDKSRSGVCSCADNMIRSSDGSCVSPVTVPLPDAAPVKLHVYVESQTITLPQSNSSLTATTTEEATDPANPLKYVWKTVSMPSDGESAVESNKNTKTLTLSNLVEGVYQFRVIVSGSSPARYGEALANVTVLPAARHNTPPKAVLEPKNQTVTLPTKKAIIDGSGSTDDTPLTNYLWELVIGPVGYQAELEPGSILTLSNLIVGNYTLKLTVTDQDGEVDSDTATIEVVKDTDYKPKAVAGEDIVIYLPDNSVTLNGNQSYDDHAIVSWEWTKVKSDDGVDLPADISGTQTPAMTVSNMQPGQYNFLLRVTDEAGQSDEDNVKVYVKHPTNRPPSAVAGDDMQLSLPLPFLTLNGSKSSDDGNISVYKWSLQSGPEGFKAPVFSCAECVVTNVTGLGVGSYVFRLMVEDNSGQTDNADINVLIKQDTNQPPVANPGANIQISLPTSQVILDGSGSSDDLAVVKWQWTRDPDSLAAGAIVGNMFSPRLIVTDLVAGTYSFNLMVADDQGLSSNKSVKVTVTQDRDQLNIIELVLNKNLSHFTQMQKNDVLGRVRLLSKGSGELSVEDVKLYSSSRQGLATLQFKVFSTTAASKNSLKGVNIVAHLKKELLADAELLGVPVLSIDTLICQNPCSGHGTCNQVTRVCECQTAWMENIFTKYFYQGESNCDWSVVYVSLASATIFLVILSCCCFGTCKRKVVKIRAKRKYSRLNTSDNIEMTDETGGSLVNSDTESEEEILFESSKKGRRLNGSVHRTNGLKNGKMTA